MFFNGKGQEIRSDLRKVRPFLIPSDRDVLISLPFSLPVPRL